MYRDIHSLRNAVVIVSLLLCSCDAPDKGTAPAPTPEASERSAPAKSPAGASDAAETPYAAITGVAKLAPDDKVGICWRERTANPFAANDADYRCDTLATTVPYPGDRAMGALSGQAIVQALQSALGARKMKTGTAKSLGPNADPKGVASGISVGNDATGFYDNYVVTDDASKHWIFLDIVLVP